MTAFVPDYLFKDVCIAALEGRVALWGQRESFFTDQDNKDNASFGGKGWAGLLVAPSLRLGVSSSESLIGCTQYPPGPTPHHPTSGPRKTEANMKLKLPPGQ